MGFNESNSKIVERLWWLLCAVVGFPFVGICVMWIAVLSQRPPKDNPAIWHMAMTNNIPWLVFFSVATLVLAVVLACVIVVHIGKVCRTEE